MDQKGEYKSETRFRVPFARTQVNWSNTEFRLNRKVLAFQ